LAGINDEIERALHAVSQDPDDAHAMQELGYLYIIAGDEDTSLGWLGRAVDAFERRGNWSKALRVQNRITAILPRCRGRSAADLAAAQSRLTALEGRVAAQKPR